MPPVCAGLGCGTGELTFAVDVGCALWAEVASSQLMREIGGDRKVKRASGLPLMVPVLFGVMRQTAAAVDFAPLTAHAVLSRRGFLGCGVGRTAAEAATTVRTRRLPLRWLRRDGLSHECECLLRVFGVLEPLRMVLTGLNASSIQRLRLYLHLEADVHNLTFSKFCLPGFKHLKSILSPSTFGSWSGSNLLFSPVHSPPAPLGVLRHCLC